MKTKKEMKPFCKNIRYFIYANEMTRQAFADELNNRLEKCGFDTKIYSANDIWTYDSRGSFPKDSDALAAIADIIGRSLEDILTVEFSIEELKRPIRETAQPKKIDTVWGKWSIDRLNELTETERDFVFDLISTGVYEEEGRWHSFFDIGLRYNKGKSVTATMYYGDDYSEERVLEWSWQEYGDYIKEFDDESTPIEMRMESDVLNNLYSIGLVRDAYCSSCGFDELPDERYEDIDGYFVAKVFFDIDRDGIVQIMEKIIERAENKLAKLLEHSKMVEWETTAE